MSTTLDTFEHRTHSMQRNVLTFRVLVRSTFCNLKAVRDELQRDVFPRLREYCQNHGARFQAIDQRSRLRPDCEACRDSAGHGGVFEEAAADQSTMRICGAEIARCQVVTPRPGFAVLLGIGTVGDHCRTRTSSARGPTGLDRIRACTCCSPERALKTGPMKSKVRWVMSSAARRGPSARRMLSAANTKPQRRTRESTRGSPTSRTCRNMWWHSSGRCARRRVNRFGKRWLKTRPLRISWT